VSAGRVRALSNIVAEAIMVSILLSWIAIIAAIVNVKAAVLVAGHSIAVPELLYCNSTACILRVIEGGEIAFDQNITQAFVLLNGSLVRLESPAALKAGDILVLSPRGGQSLLWFESGTLMYIVDLERQELSLVGS